MKVLRTDVAVLGPGAAGCIAAIEPVKERKSHSNRESLNCSKWHRPGQGKNNACHLNECEAWDANGAATE